jgi:hypothetical protein
MINKKSTAAQKKVGNGKRKSNSKARRSQSRLPALSSILQEQDQQRLGIAQLRAENCLVKRNLATLMFEDVVINKEAMLREAATQPSLEEAIAELENSLA